MPSYRLYLCVFLSLLVLSASQVSAAIIPPPGLNPGDHYRLVFVTEGSRDATSSNIDDYNAFVDAQAHLPGSLVDGIPTSWRAIASTATVSAFGNISAGTEFAPVYNLNGNLIGSTSGAIFPPLAAVLYDQFGNSRPSLVWTGTAINGQINNPYFLATGYGWATTGASNAPGSIAITYYLRPINNPLPLYAISGDLVVPAAVPEPATMLLFGIGSVVMLGAARFRRKQV